MSGVLLHEAAKHNRHSLRTATRFCLDGHSCQPKPICYNKGIVFRLQSGLFAVPLMQG